MSIITVIPIFKTIMSMINVVSHGQHELINFKDEM